jgi:FAD/FMN-containing dehydrogenase
MTSRSNALFAGLQRRGIPINVYESNRHDARDAFRDAVFNGANELSGLALAACESEADVSFAVRAAADAGVCVAVTGGGHDMFSRAFAPDNLILDLRRMSGVSVDPDARHATIGGATLTRDLLARLPADRVAPVGTIQSVGVTGFALGGGYGTLIARCGLGADAIRSARVVLADGSIVTADPEHDADLLWALKGGGSGFGVVTSMKLALHTLPSVLSAMCIWSLENARPAMLRAQDLLDRYPYDLSFFMGFMTMPTGETVLFGTPVWTGHPSMGETVLRDITSNDGAQVAYQRRVPFRETFDEETEKAWPQGRHYHLLTRSIDRINSDSIEIMIEGARTMPGSTSAIVLHDFHGAAADVPHDATAFRLRDDHFVVEIIAGWDPSSAHRVDAEKNWAAQLDVALSKVALSGGYPNLLAPSDVDRVQQFYGESATRLNKIKQRVDPNDVFRSGVGRLDP